MSTPCMRILVIDDDPLLRRTLSRVLTKAGHSVTCAAAVREGMDAFSAGAFDVVVTDVYMPDEDGLDALRQLREIRPEIPVIVMSGRLTDEFGRTLHSMMLNLGAVAALAKGVDLKPLVELVARLASRHEV